LATQAGGAAAECNAIAVGDVLTKVNDASMVGCTHELVCQAVQSAAAAASASVALEFERGAQYHVSVQPTAAAGGGLGFRVFTLPDDGRHVVTEVATEGRAVADSAINVGDYLVEIAGTTTGGMNHNEVCIKCKAASSLVFVRGGASTAVGGVHELAGPAFTGTLLVLSVFLKMCLQLALLRWLACWT
jgi:C-terminal processing protease CtpA/Prc